MRKMILTVIAAMTFGFLSACSDSGGTTLNPDEVDVTLATNPAPAAGVPVELQMQLTGVPSDMETFVSFEIRSGDMQDLIDAENKGDGLFAGTYSFPEAGSYEVYLHLYIEDLHLIKKRQVEVQ